MGIVQMGPPTEFILLLKQQEKIKTFIETGTYHGNTALWAASHFDQVITVEFSQEIYNQVTTKHGTTSNIQFLFGDSRTALADIMPELNAPAIFWLDSHWSGGATYGEGDECPLIQELEIICRSPYGHYVLIDDARLFTSPPPKPHRVEQWPSIAEVLSMFDASDQAYYKIIFDDVIIAAPMSTKTLIADYFQQLSTQERQQQNMALNEAKMSKGIRLIKDGTLLVGSSFKKSIAKLIKPSS